MNNAHAQQAQGPERAHDASGAVALLERKLDDTPGVFGWGFYEVTRGADSPFGDEGTTEVGLLLPGLIVPDTPAELVADVLDGMSPSEVRDFLNLITDVGDQFYASRAASVAINVPTGMRLGTGTTAVAKNGAGAAIVTYVTASQQAFDGGFPTAATKGAGLGWRTQWKTTYAAGTATTNGIAEAVITNETALTNVAGTAANTLARALLSPTVNKGANDTLAITWNWDVLGA